MNNRLFTTDISGRITSTVSVTDNDVIHYSGYINDPNCYSDWATHYINGEFLAAPAQPSLAHWFNDAAFSWEVNINLAKTIAKNRINQEWQLAESQGFSAYGHVFDSDTKAIQRIQGAAQGATIAKSLGIPVSIDWTCKDNSVLTMDADMLIQIPILIMQAGNVLHVKNKTLKAQIDSCNTIEEIEAVVW